MIRLQLLGAVDARTADDTPISGIVNQPKRTALLAYLAMALPRGSHRRDTILALFWPELDDTRARKALNQSIHHLRSQLGEDIIYSEGRDQIGIASGAISCDAVELEAALDRGDMDAAIALYRGDFLAGFHVSDLGSSSGGSKRRASACANARRNRAGRWRRGQPRHPISRRR